DGRGGYPKIAPGASGHRGRRRRRPCLAGRSGLALLSAYGPLPPDRAAGTRRATLRPRGVAAAETPQTGRVLAVIRCAAGRGRSPLCCAPLLAAAGCLCSPVHVT